MRHISNLCGRANIEKDTESEREREGTKEEEIKKT